MLYAIIAMIMHSRSSDRHVRLLCKNRSALTCRLCPVAFQLCSPTAHRTLAFNYSTYAAPSVRIAPVGHGRTHAHAR